MPTTIQILHASDLEGGLDAIENAPNFAAVVDGLEQDAADEGVASFLLSAGDNYIPGPFFNAGGDFGLALTYEGFYNALFGLIDTTVLAPVADTNGDGFFDNGEIQAEIDAGNVSFGEVYIRDVNGDGISDYFEEIDTASGRLDIAVMNAIGFDASAVGNHEFDAGADAFENIINYDSEEGNSLSSGRYGTVNFLQEVDTPGAQFPYLSANLDFSGDGDLGSLFTDAILTSDAFESDLGSARDSQLDPALRGSDSNDDKLAQATIVESDGESIGVLGATTQLLASISSPDGVEVLSGGSNDMAALAAVLQPVVDDLVAEGIDKIVLVSHLQQFALEEELAGLLRGVDVIVAGGSDTINADDQDRLRSGDTADRPYPVIVDDADGNPTAVVSTDGEYSYVGRLVLTFDDNGRIIPTSIDEDVSGAFATDEQGVLDVTGAATLEEAIAGSRSATDVQNLTNEVTNIVTALDGDIAGQASVFLNGDRADVRTQETNFGNLTADANLAAAQAVDADAMVSIKNGGGIRASIGALVDQGDGTATQEPTQANPLSGKDAGEISELDIDNALRFDNGLVTVDLTPAELKIVLEHAVAATAPGATPGQFPQVGGLQFSFDPSGTAQELDDDGNVITEGSRVVNVALLDAEGNQLQRIIEDGEVVGSAPATITVVTLDFLAGGGDGYPFEAFSQITDLGIGEQEALSTFLTDNFPEDGPEPFSTADTDIDGDTRIQNLSVREDTIGDDLAPEATQALTFEIVAEFQGEGEEPGDGSDGAEVVAHEAGLLYVTNGAQGRIDIFDIAADAAAGSIDLTALDGFDGVQSVAVQNGVVAVAISRDTVEQTVFGEEVELSQPGFVALFDAETRELLSRVDVGNLPDQLTFNEDGTQLLVAGEGEKNDDSDNDDNPLGTVAIIDTTDPAAPEVALLDFTAFNGLENLARDAGIRIQDGLSFAEDVEPEYIAISPDGTQAFVSLQENNAIAVVDLDTGEVSDVFSLGTVDFASESKIDPNDDGVIDIRNFDNLVGLRMADAIASFEVDGQVFIATANEGDSRGFDEDRVGDLVDDGLVDESVDTTGLERLEISTTDGDTDGDGDIDVLTTFSSRSFSIFDAEGNLVFDSGPDFEQIIAERAPERFNDDDGDDGEDRSDAKGPEPEAITIGEIDGQTYAFIGLERDSGVMIYDVTDPANATFVEYIPPLFVDDAEEGQVARHGPETIAFIPAEESTTGNAQIAVAYEISGSTVVYDLAPNIPDLSIGEIQGAGHISAFVGQVVATAGIVTAIDGAGFYLQDPTGDGDDATSDAIFVFTGFGNTDGVSIGDAIEITGTVGEFIPGGASTGNLSTTQISNAEFEVISSGNALPDAVILGAEGRQPPTDSVISDSELPVNLQNEAGTFNPETDGIDFFESLEGMLVTIPDALTISATNRFGETWVVGDDGANVTSPTGTLNDRGGLQINANAEGTGDLNPERIQLQFDNDLLPDGFDPEDLDVGTDLSDVTGVVDYGFGNFEVRVTETFEVEAESALEEEVTEIEANDDALTVATYNVLNVTAAPADNDAEQIARLAAHVADNLGAPDILALQEIQDDSGVANDGTLDATQTLQALVDAIEAAGGPRYEFVSAIVDEDGENGGVPGGNIRNAFLWNPERVDLKSVETLESDVLETFGVSDPAAFDGTRDPLLGVFEFNGEDVTLINNHFSSRFGSDPIFGAIQPFTQAGEEERERQALAINEVVDALLLQDPDARISVLGDFNTFEFTDELAEDLPGSGDEQVLTNLLNLVPGDEAYTFIFQGNSQALDHIFATDSLLDGVEVDVVHLNVDFADFASDHEPIVAAFQIEATELFVRGTAGDDRLNGGNADDQLRGLAGDDEILGRAGDDRARGGEGDDDIDGGIGNDVLFGDAGDDMIAGGDGDDIARGDDGDDTIAGGEGDDRLLGNAGDDMIAGGDGDDLLRGGTGDDNLDGGAGNDELVGWTGDDTLNGGDDDDILIGGDGGDTFIFVGSFGSDVVRDFEVGIDQLQFGSSTLADATLEETVTGTRLTFTGEDEGEILLRDVFDFDTGTDALL